MKLVKQKRLLSRLGDGGVLVERVVPFYLLAREDPPFGGLRHGTVTSLPGPHHQGYVSPDK